MSQELPLGPDKMVEAPHFVDYIVRIICEISISFKFIILILHHYPLLRGLRAGVGGKEV